jgi:hypothetical protein
MMDREGPSAPASQRFALILNHTCHACASGWIKPFGGIGCTHHALWVNHTEIRCQRKKYRRRGSARR